jgi:hypothetical protein
VPHWLTRLPTSQSNQSLFDLIRHVEGWQACCNLQVPSANPFKRGFSRLPGGLGPRFPDVLPGIESIGNRSFESRFSKSRLPALSGRASGAAALLALGTLKAPALSSLTLWMRGLLRHSYWRLTGAQHSLGHGTDSLLVSRLSDNQTVGRGFLRPLSAKRNRQTPEANRTLARSVWPVRRWSHVWLLFHMHGRTKTAVQHTQCNPYSDGKVWLRFPARGACRPREPCRIKCSVLYVTARAQYMGHWLYSTPITREK